MSSSPGCLVTRSDSPVSSDSSTSMRPSPTIGPSTTTWSPGSSRSTSPSTTSDGSISWTAPVAQHVRLGPQQDRHLVHHALGADLLEQADDGVGADHEHHGERVERLAQDQEQDAEEVEEVVDEVEDVVADDATVGAAGADLDVVALAGRAPASASAVLRPCGAVVSVVLSHGRPYQNGGGAAAASRAVAGGRVLPSPGRRDVRSVDRAMGTAMRDGAVLIIQHQAIGQPGTILETLIADGVGVDLRHCTGARTPAPTSSAATARYRARRVHEHGPGRRLPFCGRSAAAAAALSGAAAAGHAGAQQLGCVRGASSTGRAGRRLDADPAVGATAVRGRPVGFMARVARAVVHRPDRVSAGAAAGTSASRLRAGRRAWGAVPPEIDADARGLAQARQQGLRERAPQCSSNCASGGRDRDVVTRALPAVGATCSRRPTSRTPPDGGGGVRRPRPTAGG